MWYSIFIFVCGGIVGILIQQIVIYRLRIISIEKKRKALRSDKLYISLDKFNRRNDEKYEEYVKKPDKEVHGVPVDKMEMTEDIRAENKLNKLL